MSNLAFIVPMLPEFKEEEDILYFIGRCEILKKFAQQPKSKNNSLNLSEMYAHTSQNWYKNQPIIKIEPISTDY